jgi:hypothetical protein
MADPTVVATLQAENARLVALLEAHGIEWRQPQPTALVVREQESSRLSTAEKVALFRRLFRGRTDVYPVRWESKTTGKSGYAPACANEWRAGVCEKPRIKCGDCSNRLLIPLSDVVIYNHLAGEHTGSLRKWAVHKSVSATFRRRLHWSKTADRGHIPAVNHPPPITKPQQSA